MKEKVVLNKGCGKFSLSHEAIIRYVKLLDVKLYIWITKNGYYYSIDSGGKYEVFTNYQIQQINRTDSALIQTVKELGTKVQNYWDSCRLEIEELIPNKIWYIKDNNGKEEIKYL